MTKETKFIGTIEFLDGKNNLTGLRTFAILNSVDSEIISAIPVEIFAGGNVQFHQLIKNNEFEVISIDGDKISDLMDYIPLEKPTVEDKTDEIALGDFASAEE